MTAERPDSSYKHSPQKTTKSFAKILDTHKISGNSATQGVRTVCALKNGQLLHSDNNIIIFSHQFLQTASVVLGFFILNRKGR